MAWRYWLLRQPRSLHLFTSPLEREIDITGFFQSLFYTKVVSGQQLNMDDCEYVRYVLSFTRNICISRHCEIALRIRRSLCHSKLMHCFTRACVAWLKLAKSGGQRPPPQQRPEHTVLYFLSAYLSKTPATFHSPAFPGGHSHLKLPTSSWHVAPWKHDDGVQSSTFSLQSAPAQPFTQEHW